MHFKLQILIDRLQENFHRHIDVIEKREGIFQLLLPLYHEDEDMIELYVDSTKSNHETIRLCDFGMGIMRLSYSYDIDTPNKEKIFQKILNENGLLEENGNVYLDTSPEMIYQAVLQISQGIAKVCSMRYFDQNTEESMSHAKR